MQYNCPAPVHQRLVLLTDVHYCQKTWYDISGEERMEALIRGLQKQMQQHPFDEILCLGDYSLDFWAWEAGGSYVNPPHISHTKNFVQQVLPRLPGHACLIPGNHEQYGNEKWKELTGFPRQFSVVYGQNLFLMLDTFAGNLDPQVHSDGTYTGIDVPFVREMLQQHPGKRVFLCMHDLIPEQESEEAARLAADHPEICCAFAGHIHKSCTTLLDAKWGGLPLIHCGDFSYSDSRRPSWGWQVLDLSEGVRTWYQRSDTV